jgi:hypothetical protein
VYQYVVDGVQYDVPNYGMCWKLIDFGFSSSTELFGCYDNGTMLACSHALSVADTYGLQPKAHSAEMYDLVRFMTAAKDMAEDNLYLDERWRHVVEFFETQLRVATAVFRDLTPDEGERTARSLHASISVAARLYGTSHADKVRYAKLPTSNYNSGVLQEFFRRVASPYRQAGPPVDGPHVFNADVRLFEAFEPLGAFENTYYYVDWRGRLMPIQDPAVIA